MMLASMSARTMAEWRAYYEVKRERDEADRKKAEAQAKAERMAKKMSRGG
jgi:hypothetical protein